MEKNQSKGRLQRAFHLFGEAYYWHEVAFVALALAGIGGYLFYLAWKVLTG